MVNDHLAILIPYQSENIIEDTQYYRLNDVALVSPSSLRSIMSYFRYLLITKVANENTDMATMAITS